MLLLTTDETTAVRMVGDTRTTIVHWLSSLTQQSISVLAPSPSPPSSQHSLALHYICCNPPTSSLCTVYVFQAHCKAPQTAVPTCITQLSPAVRRACLLPTNDKLHSLLLDLYRVSPSHTSRVRNEVIRRRSVISRLLPGFISVLCISFISYFVCYCSQRHYRPKLAPV